MSREYSYHDLDEYGQSFIDGIVHGYMEKTVKALTEKGHINEDTAMDADDTKAIVQRATTLVMINNILERLGNDK
jgi:hypothetical protein